MNELKAAVAELEEFTNSAVDTYFQSHLDDDFDGSLYSECFLFFWRIQCAEERGEPITDELKKWLYHYDTFGPAYVDIPEHFDETRLVSAVRSLVA